MPGGNKRNRAVPTAEETTKDFPIGDIGALNLTFPKTWKYSFQKSPPGVAPYLSLSFEPQYDADFLILITSVPAGSGLKKMGPRGVLEMTGNRALRSSEELQLDLMPLAGIETSGCFYTLTCKKCLSTRNRTQAPIVTKPSVL